MSIGKILLILELLQNENVSSITVTKSTVTVRIKK